MFQSIKNKKNCRICNIEKSTILKRPKREILSGFSQFKGKTDNFVSYVKLIQMKTDNCIIGEANSREN